MDNAVLREIWKRLDTLERRVNIQDEINMRNSIKNNKDPNKHDHKSDSYCVICVPVHRMNRE